MCVIVNVIFSGVIVELMEFKRKMIDEIKINFFCLNLLFNNLFKMELIIVFFISDEIIIFSQSGFK